VPAFATDEWFRALEDRINASRAYRDAAADWEGDIAFVIQAEPDRRVPADIWGYLDLWHGACRDARVVTPERGVDARYVLTAPYTRWKDIVRGDLDPIKAMMQGKLKVRGDLPTIVRYVRAADELVQLTGEVETSFPDEI
jgi:putative sterol carrier protein